MYLRVVLKSVQCRSSLEATVFYKSGGEFSQMKEWKGDVKEPVSFYTVA